MISFIGLTGYLVGKAAAVRSFGTLRQGHPDRQLSGLDTPL
jgi:hypothetical protein